MKLEQQVAPLEMSKRLAELGVNAESVFEHVEEYDKPNTIRTTTNADQYELKQTYPAYTVAELGEMLPSGYDTKRLPDDLGDEFYRGYDDLGFDIFGCDYTTEAQARAAMLIHLLETNHLTAEECNKRISCPQS